MVRNRPKVRKKFVVFAPKITVKKRQAAHIEQPAAYLFAVAFPFALGAEVERDNHCHDCHHGVRLQAPAQGQHSKDGHND